MHHHHIILPYILGVISTLAIFAGGFVIVEHVDQFKSITYQAETTKPPIDVKPITVTKETQNTTTSPLPNTLAEATTSATTSNPIEKPNATSSTTDEVIVDAQPKTTPQETPPEQNSAPEPLTTEQGPLQKPGSEPLTFAQINNQTREALVNIFCLTTGPHAAIAPISGSGTIIDPRGVVLTNAHIAQTLLFRDVPQENFVNCVIRTGSPAEAMYEAKLLYLSPPWVSDNADNLTIENPTGTGEHDFALLYITGAVTGKTLPTSFPYIEPELDTTTIEPDQEILIGGYPAGMLGGRTIQNDLYAATSITTVGQIYTFVEETFDVISLGGTIVAQQGSSGGAVVNNEGKLIGLISNSSWGDTTADRDLRAITLAHINRSLIEHNNSTLEELLSGNLQAKADAFGASAAPTLLQILLRSFSSD